jgi:hypothetical protein
MHFGRSLEDIREYPLDDEPENGLENELDNEVCLKYACRSALSDYRSEHILTLISFRHPAPASTAVYHFYI